MTKDINDGAVISGKSSEFTVTTGLASRFNIKSISLALVMDEIISRWNPLANHRTGSVTIQAKTIIKVVLNSL